MKLSNNEVTLTGFIGKDAEAKTTKNGKPFTRVSIATTQGRKNKETGEWSNSTTWHDLIGFGPVAETMAKLTKGSFVQVRGMIRYYDLPAKDGKPARRVTDILVNGFAKLDRSRRGEAVQEGSAA